jgi:hypothetical protein
MILSNFTPSLTRIIRALLGVRTLPPAANAAPPCCLALACLLKLAGGSELK